jgi:hypothetical protein
LILNVVVFRSFLSELSNIVNGVTNESMESVLLRHGARIVEVSDDQKWSVDPPVIEMPNESETELEGNVIIYVEISFCLLTYFTAGMLTLQNHCNMFLSLPSKLDYFFRQNKV